MKRENDSAAKIPISKKFLVDGFCWYSRGLIRKSFMSMGVNGTQSFRSVPTETSIVVYANHASWWDPIVAMLCRQVYLPERVFYAPIDADQLENYGVLKKMGFYGVQLQSFSGSQNFLVQSKAILNSPNASIWITPEGRFCDVRDFSQPLMPGLSHLAARGDDICLIPLAIEYPFWDDSRPHIFSLFGEPIFSRDLDESDRRSKDGWNQRLTNGLRNTQRQLSDLVLQRSAASFDYLIESRPRKLGWYDWARSWSAKLQGKNFDPRHSKSMKR